MQYVRLGKTDLRVSADFKGERFTRDLEVVERLKEFAATRGITLVGPAPEAMP